MVTLLASWCITMNNIIHAEHRFGADAMTNDIGFLQYAYARYWLGNGPELAKQFSAGARYERLYHQWLQRRGDEVADRR